MVEPQDPLDGFGRDWDELSDRVDAARARAAAAPAFRWATVTEVGALRIRLDGDEAALLGTPLTTLSGLVVGDRVRVELQGTRAVITGRAGGMMRIKSPYNNEVQLLGGFTAYNQPNNRAYFGGGDGANPTAVAHTYFAMQHGDATFESQAVAWIQSNMTAENRQVFAVRRSGHVVTRYLPFADCSGVAALSSTIAAGGGATLNVTFPSGAFTKVPDVQATPYDASRLSVAILNRTVNGCQIRVDNFTSGAAAPAGIGWHASQQNP
ncbi:MULTISPECIES: hypothetical protein [unclassified Leucobacter]|uniref:hypothetical protein n=1 Tax=unclassified Leucobacter TaxID=2621730 RepID=UPI0006992EBD|nr:hypothetical protein [Leucobacter sp. Ag1]